MTRRHGTGSLYQRRDGRWIGRLPDGRGGHVHFTGTDPDDVERRMDAARRERDRTTSSGVRGAERLRDLADRYMTKNVSNLLAVDGGRAFGDVLGDLAARGYDAEWDCLPAAAVGAPHLRDRVWIVGARTEQRWDVAHAHHGRPRDALRAGRDAAGHGGSDVAHAVGERGRGRPATPGQAQGGRPFHSSSGPSLGVPHAVFAGLEGHERAVLALADHRRHNTDPARPGWWAAEPGLGRVADGVPRRVDRLRCLGNGVVPQVAEFIGWRLRAMIEAQELEAAA